MFVTGQKGLISCIITTYKRDVQMLTEAIESALAQTYKDIELIVVSDNPPDSDYARAVADSMSTYKGIRLIQMAQNGGAQKARNAGVMAAQGEYCAFLDDDDTWFPEKLSKQIALMSEGVGLVYCMGRYMRASDGKISPYYNSQRFAAEVTYDDLLRRDAIGTMSQMLIRRRALIDVGMFDIDMPARQDYEMCLRLTEKWRALGVPEVLFTMRVHEGDRVSKNAERSMTGFKLVYDKHVAQKSGSVRCEYWWMASWQKLFRGDFNRRFYCVRRAFMASPARFFALVARGAVRTIRGAR